MTKEEINIFIEEMEQIGDVWELEQVEEVYGECGLEEALVDRKSLLSMFFENVEKVINR